MTEQSPMENKATVAATPENAEKMVEGVLDGMDKGMPVFVVKGGGLWELWATATEMSQYRLTRYRDYDDMVTDSLIASALELVTDDACQFSADRGASIWAAKGANQAWVQQALEDLQVDDNLWGWIHNTALYGDFFPRFMLDKDSSSKSGFKFRSLDSSLHPAEVRRLDIDGRLSGFMLQEEHGKITSHAPWEFVHFMLNNRPRFERHKLRIKGYKSEEAPSDLTPQRGEKGTREVIATSSYGTSFLDPARHVYRVLKLLEQSLALARLNRSPLIRVFYVNTTGMTPKERKGTLDELHLRFKENLSVDMRQNFYKSDYNPLSYNADLFIPITDGAGQITAETLGGELNIKDIVDIDYQRNKLFAAIRIPKAYLGFEEAMPGTLGSTTLVRLDIRYARSVKKIQRAAISGATRLLEIKYALEKGERPDKKKIAVEMETISGAEELDRMEAWSQKLNVAQQFLQIVTELEEKGAETKPLIEYVFDQVLGLKSMVKSLKIGKVPPEDVGGDDEDEREEEARTSFDDLNSSTDLKEKVTSLIMDKDFDMTPLMGILRDNIPSIPKTPPRISKHHDFKMPMSEEKAPKDGPAPVTYAFLEDVVREPVPGDKPKEAPGETPEVDLDTLSKEPLE